MKQRLLLSLCLLFVTVGTLWAQDRTISGTVKDAQGEPVIGANIIAIGADRDSPLGTATGLEGDFTLKLSKADSAIRITFVGMEDQVVAVGNKAVFNITMVEATLAEVIVETGYFTTTQRKKVGASTKVDGRAFEAVPQASLDNMIQGRSSGVLVQAGSGAPGSSARVLIRGQGSINGGTDPLYVIDGIPKTANDFAQLNPNDIESMDVLKDAASTSMYGSRAANGVILITTKRGKDGKVQYGYRFQAGIENRTQDVFNMMNASQKNQWELDNGVINQAIFDQRTAAGINENWPDAVFRQGTNVSHELSAMGGNEKASFYWSGSYYKQDGIVINSDFERFTTRINLDYKATEKTKLQLTLGAGYSRYNEIYEFGNNLNNPIVAAFSANPYEPVRDPETGEWNTTSILGFNPLRQQLLNDEKRNRLRFNGAVLYQTEIIDNLIFRSRIGLEAGTTNIFRYFDPTSFLGGQYNGGYLSESDFRFFNYNNVNSLQYERTINDDHTITGVIATEILGEFSEQNFHSGTSLGDSRIRVSNAVGEPISTTGTKTESSLAGALFVGNYSYKDKYIIEASIRRDGSSRFGSDNKFANFWAVGATWNVTDEKWFDKPALSFISGLKLRASIGTQGNQNIGNFTWRGTYAVNAGSSYIGSPGFAPTRIQNPGLTWEKQRLADIGLDFALFKKRIEGTVELYNKTSQSLLYPKIVTRTSGFGTIQDNIGKIRNQGIELELAGYPLRKRNLEWKVSANYTINDNEVLELDQGRQLLGTGQTVIREGHPLFSHYVVRYAGVNAANGDPLYLDVNGNVTPNFSANDRVVLGQAIAPKFGGLDNVVNVTLPNELGRVDLSVFLIAVHGIDRYNNVRWFTENANFALYNQSQAMLNEWRQPGDVTEVHRFEQGLTQYSTSRTIEDASFVRLRNVVLGYTLPESLVKKIKLYNVRVYAQALNLYTWTKFKGFDPETSGALSNFNYPVARSYTVGVQVQF